MLAWPYAARAKKRRTSMLSSCPGCGQLVGPKKRERHLSVCRKPSFTIELVRQFVSTADTCRYCARFLAPRYLAEHERWCKRQRTCRSIKQMATTKPVCDLPVQGKTAICNSRESQPTRRRIENIPICKFCDQPFGMYSARHHALGDCMQSTPDRHQASTIRSGHSANQQFEGWWHGGE